jgi:hypothetical protein
VRPYLYALPLLALAATADAATCPSVQPSPAWVCVGGGWLPPGHPGIPAPPVLVPAPPVEPKVNPDPYAPRFRVGKRYQRGTTDVHIAGTGQLIDGTHVLFAVCMAVGDGCFDYGYVRLFPIGVSAADFVEVQ